MRNNDEFWERRGQAVYTEEDGTPGKATLIADYHGVLTIDEVQTIVDQHNDILTLPR